jgi:protein subunit release factor A
MDFSPEDLRIDVARMVDDSPCAVRVTHTPTGMTVQVDDQPSTDANRDLALVRLRDKLAEP